VHVVARCNNREFYFTTPEEIATVLGKLRGMARDYELTLYAYTVMSNHIHLLLQAPGAGTLARPLRWFLTETARAFHRVRGRRGHFWERRYRACVVEDDTYGLAVYAIWTGNRSGLASSRIPRPTPGPVAPPTPWGHPTCS
jgi:putative transposase